MQASLRYPWSEVPAPGEVTEIRPGVLWLRMPLPMRLNHINLYLLRDQQGWWIVDTGINSATTRELWEQIFSRHLDGLPVIGMICTHCHPDHVGVAGWLSERWRIPLWMTHAEYHSGRIHSAPSDGPLWEIIEFYQRTGVDRSFLEFAQKRSRTFSGMIAPMPRAYRRVLDGDVLRIGGHDWEAVVGHGHSPEHLCLLDRARGLLISGDQVIPIITSNVSVMGTEPEANPLRDWIDSHHKFLRLPGEVLVLPAHNTPFYGLHERLRALIAHHDDHLQALEEACVKPSTALELLPVIFKRELDAEHTGMALGECIAHLHLLMQRGAIERRLDDNGHYRYRSVDSTLAKRARPGEHEHDDAPIMEFENDPL